MFNGTKYSKIFGVFQQPCPGFFPHFVILKVDLIYFFFHVRYECMFVLCFLLCVFSDPNIANYLFHVSWLPRLVNFLVILGSQHPFYL